jgi:hypothetical protein
VASPHTFDPCLGDLFAAWGAGACAALAPRAALFTALAACLAASAATHVLTTPAMLGGDLTGLGFGVLGFGCKAQSLAFRVLDFGFRVLGQGIKGLTG